MKRGSRNILYKNFFVLAVLLVAVSFLFIKPKITGYDTVYITAAPDTPSLILPQNSSHLLFNEQFGFNWSGSDPDGDGISYHLQVGNSSNFEDFNLSINLTLAIANYTLQANNLSLGKYYWRVRANDTNTSYSSFSVAREFDIVYAVINMTSHSNNSVISAGTSQIIQINEVNNGDLISGVDIIFSVNGINTTAAAFNTTNTSITNYTYSYSVPNVNSTYIDVISVGYNGSRNINVTSYSKLRITRAFSEAGNPNATFLCGLPTTLEQNKTMNITLNFTTGVLVDSVNLTIGYPNGSNFKLNEVSNNFAESPNNSFYYRYNYTFNTSLNGDYLLRAEIRDINRPTSSVAVRTQPFTVSNLVGVNLTSIGANLINVRDVCDNSLQFSGSNITGVLPSGLYNLDVINENNRLSTNLINSNISISNNVTSICNFTDSSESISVPITTRAVDQFILSCNTSVNFLSVNLTYNYTSILSTIQSELSLQFYKCENASSCSWVEITDVSLNSLSNLFKANISNFSAFMLSERVTPTGGGTVSGGGGGSASKQSGGANIATIDLIKPDSLQFSENETIRIPIILRNTGNSILNGIFLKAEVYNESFQLRFGESFIETIGVNRTYETYLEIKNNGAYPGQYDVTISSTVTQPSFKDTTKIFFNLKEKDYAKKASLLQQIEFMNELFKGNPECLEFSEVTGQIKGLIDNKKYDEAGMLIDNTVEGCKDLVSSNEIDLNLPFTLKNVRQDFILFFAEIVAFMSLTAILFYFYMKKRNS